MIKPIIAYAISLIVFLFMTIFLPPIMRRKKNTSLFKDEFSKYVMPLYFTISLLLFSAIFTVYIVAGFLLRDIIGSSLSEEMLNIIKILIAVSALFKSMILVNIIVNFIFRHFNVEHYTKSKSLFKIINNEYNNKKVIFTFAGLMMFLDIAYLNAISF